MDPIMVTAVSLLILIVIWRLRRTFRGSRGVKEEDIQRKLAELRKKRDEE